MEVHTANKNAHLIKKDKNDKKINNNEDTRLLSFFFETYADKIEFWKILRYLPLQYNIIFFQIFVMTKKSSEYK